MSGNRILSNAPCFEDVFLFRCLREGAPRRYAEFDAADPDLDSVSQWFDLLGWSGLIAVAGERERWQAARPNAVVTGSEDATPAATEEEYGFVRFAVARADAGMIVAALRPLIIVTPPGFEGFFPGYTEARGDAARLYLVRVEAAALCAGLRLPLRRDEFRAPDAQAATLGRMLAGREARIEALQAEGEAARARHAAEREAELARLATVHEAELSRLAAAHEVDRARLIGEFDTVLAVERERGAAEIRARDARIGALDALAREREVEILARLEEIASLRSDLAAALGEAARLRPREREIARLTHALDWPAAPRALRAVLPLARLLRRVSYLLSRGREKHPASGASDAPRHR